MSERPEKRRVLRALHLASFAGNAGDGAMHDGAYRTRDEDCAFEFEYTPLEVRDFIHWRTRTFDQSFLDYANSFDLLLIGGNSTFQMWRTDTASGTYFDFAPDYLTGLQVPTVFYGVGCDATRGVDAGAMGRFRMFMDACMASDQFLFSLRNDGSQRLLREVLGDLYADAMAVIPDGGLFAEPDTLPQDSERVRLVINLAGDMPEVRYGAANKGGLASSVTSHLDAILGRHEMLDCVFAPHIYSDLGLIAECLERLDDRLRRTRVSVAPYLVRPQDWRRVLGEYRGADAVLAMRFHANLCAAGMGSPVTGLSTHHKISGLYEGLSLSDRCHRLDPAGGVGEVVGAAMAQVEADLDPSVGERARLRQKHARDTERARLGDFHADMDRWIADRL